MNKYSLIIALFVVSAFFFACNTSTKNPDVNKNDSVTTVESKADTTASFNSAFSPSAINPAETEPVIELVPLTPKGTLGSQLPQGEGAPMRKEGIHFASIGKFKEAVQAFNESLKREPEHSDTWFYRAKAKADMKDYAGAEADYKKAISLRNDVAAYYYYRGEMLANQKKYDAALADFEQTILLEPTYTEAINYKGVMLANKGNHEGALSFYDQAIEKRPDYALAFYNKATSLAALERFTEAEADFSSAIRLQTDYNEAYINRGNVRFMLGKYAEAIADYSKALEQMGTNGDIYYNRAFSYLRLKENEKACTDWVKAKQLGHPTAGEMLKQYCGISN